LGKIFHIMPSKLSKKQQLLLSKFGENVARIRKEKGITQVDLSYEMDTDKANIRRIEAGQANVTLLTLQKLSEKLSVDMRDFLKIK
jgi:transcriptional regulator with XRE-family HTH domain